jgi:ubiquinone biosynthesis protein
MRPPLPRPHDEFTTPRILVMDLLDGIPLGRADELIAAQGLDRAALARTLLRYLLRQIMVDGVFHAHPHRGNILVLADGQLALLDFGSVGHRDTELQSALFDLLLAIDKRDPAAPRDAFIEITDSYAEVVGRALGLVCVLAATTGLMAAILLASRAPTDRARSAALCRLRIQPAGH